MKCDNLSCNNVMKAVCDAMFQEQLNERGAPPDYAHYWARHWNDYNSILIENTNSFTQYYTEWTVLSILFASAIL